MKVKFLTLSDFFNEFMIWIRKLEEGGIKIFGNGRITRTSKSQNGRITSGQIISTMPCSQNFRGVFLASPNFEL